MNTYNGWTNRQTWNISMIYQEMFIDMSEEQTYDSAEHMADSFEMIVDELELDTLSVHSLAKQAVGEYLEAVNWLEIAEHYYEEEEEEEDLNITSSVE